VKSTRVAIGSAEQGDLRGFDGYLTTAGRPERLDGARRVGTEAKCTQDAVTWAGTSHFELGRWQSDPVRARAPALDPDATSPPLSFAHSVATPPCRDASVGIICACNFTV